MSETEKTDAAKAEQKPAEQSFTQSDVDRIVQERVNRERAKYGDYDALKAQAEGAKTAEQRIADLEQRLAASDAREKHAAKVTEIAKAHRVSDPDDIALLMGISDDDALAAQAKRLGTRDADQQRRNTYVPSEGTQPDQSGADGDMRQLTRSLFHRSE